MPPHARLVDEPAATPRSGSRANPLRTRPRRMTTLEILAKDGRERIAKMKQQASRMKTAPGVQGEPPTLVGRIVDPAGSDDTERALRAKAQRERAEQEELELALAISLSIADEQDQAAGARAHGQQPLRTPSTFADGQHAARREEQEEDDDEEDEQLRRVIELSKREAEEERRANYSDLDSIFSANVFSAAHHPSPRQQPHGMTTASFDPFDSLLSTTFQPTSTHGQPTSAFAEDLFADPFPAGTNNPFRAAAPMQASDPFFFAAPRRSAEEASCPVGQQPARRAAPSAANQQVPGRDPFADLGWLS